MSEGSEAADLVVKAGIQAAEGAVSLAGSGMKNVAALILTLSRQDYKVVGQASAKRLAREQSPSKPKPTAPKEGQSPEGEKKPHRRRRYRPRPKVDGGNRQPPKSE